VGQPQLEAQHVVRSLPAPLHLVAASADGSVLALADWTERTAAPGSGLWVVHADGTSRQLPTGRVEGSWFSVMVSPDARWVAAAGEDHLVCRWQLDSGELTHTYPGSHAFVRELRASPTGGWIAAGADKGTVITWDLATGTLLGQVAIGTASISAMEIDPTRRYIAAGTNTGHCAIIDTAPSSPSSWTEGRP
jgi:WD40 repeat protein